MAVSPPLVSLAEQFTGLPMQDLIGAPLLAAAQANSMMAATQTKFLLDTAFSYDAATNTYSPVIITMTLTRSALVAGVVSESDPDPEPRVIPIKTTFELPLLTILPLNSLAVDNVDVTFDMEVKSSFSEATSEAAETALAAESSFSAKYGFGLFSAEVKGSVAYDSKTSSSRDTHYEKSNSAQYSVKVHAGQLPLPQGVNTIIQAFTNAITPIEMPQPTTNN